MFSRYHQNNITKIRGIESNLCKAIEGFDCNALYASCIAQEMPTGMF